MGQGVEQAWRHILGALDAAGAQAGLGQRPSIEACALGLGLAGAGRESQRQAFLAQNPGFPIVVLHTDAAATLAGAHAGQAGIVVMAGTGSVAAARLPNGELFLRGGWGFPVGDEGSGAWMGLRAMTHTQKALEQRAIAGPLADHIQALCGTQRAELLQWCAGAGQRGYATLAPLVFAAAEQGDTVADALVREAASHLEELALSCDRSLPIVVSGTVAERLWKFWSLELRQRVRAPQGDALTGALSLLQGTTLV